VNVAVVILLAVVSLDVSRARTITVPRSIERTVIRIGAGLVQSYGTEDGLQSLCNALEGDRDGIEIRDARLLVDGQRTGNAFCRVCRGLTTIGLFVFDRAYSGDSVELRYTLLYRGLAIHRQVTITDGQIVSRAAFACQMGPQGRLRAVWLTATAAESPQGTTITTAATVRANSAICPQRSTSRFQVVNRLAGRAIAGKLDVVLRQAESEGRRLSSDGHELLMGSVSRFADRVLHHWK